MCITNSSSPLFRHGREHSLDSPSVRPATGMTSRPGAASPWSPLTEVSFQPKEPTRLGFDYQATINTYQNPGD